MVNIPGLEERETAAGVHVVRLNYIADPMKRSDEWKEEASRGMSKRDWEREMENNWTIATGMPVYADEFIRENHVSSSLEYMPGLPIYRGHDFGLTPACVWGQLDSLGRLNILGEMVTWDGRGAMKTASAVQFIPPVFDLHKRLFPGATFYDYADPAGWSRAESDEKTCIQIMRTLDDKINPQKGPVTFEARKTAILDVLTKSVGGKPKIRIHVRCKMILEGLGGAYKFEEIGDTGKYREVVEKNAWSHPINALEYLVGSVYNIGAAQDSDQEEEPEGEPDRHFASLYY